MEMPRKEWGKTLQWQKIFQWWQGKKESEMFWPPCQKKLRKGLTLSGIHFWSAGKMSESKAAVKKDSNSTETAFCTNAQKRPLHQHTRTSVRTTGIARLPYTLV